MALSARRTQPTNDYSRLFPICGCWYYVPNQRLYLPLVKTQTHVSVLSTASHTTLKQTFISPSSRETISRCTYEFPLYDGISITGFTCTIGARTLYGVVNERVKATEKFDAAVARGETAGLLEQDVRASDVFRTVLGNIPPGETIDVHINYVGELKQDAEVNGIRLTIPSIIAPRYGDDTRNHQRPSTAIAQGHATSITVDIDRAEGSTIQAIESPSHPIRVSMGTTSTDPDAELTLTKGSASLSLQDSCLDKDFVLLIKAKDADTPKAILERHATLKDHQALMMTLVPRFNLPLIQPEVVFVADRSGSMRNNIEMLKQAMDVFLRSLPPGVKFNICSFGNRSDFLWDKSQSYTKESLDQASRHVQTFESNYGGTETLRALQATVGRRYPDIPLEIILLTDGDIWDQHIALTWLGDEVKKSNNQIRAFPLGIGNGVSHSLIEGIARAGNGFAQAVQAGERMDSKVVRMLKGALSPHLSDFTLEVAFGNDDDLEMVERVVDNLTIRTQPRSDSESKGTGSQPVETSQAPISLFDPAADPFTPPKDSITSEPELPDVPTPTLLQAPSTLPALYPFVRTTAYLLLSPSLVHRNPEAVILRASSQHGPLELRIPVTTLGETGTTVHCLAARKAAQDLEENRGWLHDAKNDDGELLSKKLPSKFADLVQKEAVRLGETFQVANRWCSFVAVEGSSQQDAQAKKETIREPLRDEDPQLNREDPSAVPVMKRATGMTFSLSGRKRMDPIGPGGKLNRQSVLVPSSAPRAIVPGLPPQQYASSPAPRAAPLRAPMYSDDDDSAPSRGAGSLSIHRVKRLRRKGINDSPPSPESSRPPPSPAQRVHDIIALQEFDGRWTTSRALVALLGVDSAALGGCSDIDVTVAVACLLRDQLGQEKEVWEMVVEKARAWWLQQSKEGGQVDFEVEGRRVLGELMKARVSGGSS